jgi:hypothetical protein
VTPCYPALALLAGNYIDRWSRQSSVAFGGRGWLAASFATLAVVGVVITAAVPMAAKEYLPGEEWLGLIGLVPLVAGAACLALVLVRNFRWAAGGLGASAVAFAVLLFAVAADRVDQHQKNHLLLSMINSQSPQPQIASYQTLEPSWVFYGERPIKEYSAANSGGRQAAVHQVADFLLSNPSAYLITTQGKLSELAPKLPPDIVVLSSVPYFLRDEQLVLLGRGGQAGLTNAEPVTAAVNDLRQSSRPR